LSAEIQKSKEELTTYKSKNFFTDFETETDRIDKFAKEKITDEFSKLSLDLRNDDRNRLQQSLLQVNIELRNAFRQSYIEMREMNSTLDFAK